MSRNCRVTVRAELQLELSNPLGAEWSFGSRVTLWESSGPLGAEYPFGSRVVLWELSDPLSQVILFEPSDRALLHMETGAI